MRQRDYPLANEELIEEVKKAFDFSYIVAREDLTSEEKIGYYKGVQEFINLLNSWSE